MTKNVNESDEQPVSHGIKEFTISSLSELDDTISSINPNTIISSTYGHIIFFKDSVLQSLATHSESD